MQMKQWKIRLSLVGRVAIFITIAAITSHASAVEEPPLATAEEVTEALESFKEWINTIQAEDYDQQWLLTDPRIRQWFDKGRWKKRLRGARKQSGAVLSIEVEAVAPVTASQLPCTEMKHCFRKDVQYVFVLIRSTYEKAEPAQPEYVVMAKSDEGWKFGGGTFPDTPMGETSAILDRKDESRYRYRDADAVN
jgi:hypothetical protein